jgi:hypothetical protein
LEQWEHIQFLLQQMAQPHTYPCWHIIDRLSDSS